MQQSGRVFSANTQKLRLVEVPNIRVNYNILSLFNIKRLGFGYFEMNKDFRMIISFRLLIIRAQRVTRVLMSLMGKPIDSIELKQQLLAPNSTHHHWGVLYD